MHCICLCQQKYLCDQASRWCKSGESACQALEMWKVVVTNLAGPGIKQGLPHLILLYSIKHTSLPTFQMKFLYFNTNGITKQLLSRCVYFVFFILYSGNLPFIDKLLIILQTSFNPSDIRLRTCQSRKSIAMHCSTFWQTRSLSQSLSATQSSSSLRKKCWYCLGHSGRSGLVSNVNTLMIS